ncbi:shikimate kinase [Trueperella pecoris]|uniref:shikimate kinase n=1 Tax=Trueperella pecoris TaxID=2733571 RepID=UPI00186BA560|nr:shikimate kinase [Trueperella pecoris]QOQ38858.1 hypothetical protein HLG82_04965 [Trueperella pecoris]
MSAIFLVGASGTGKSAIVSALGEAGWTVADVDLAVATRVGLTVADLYLLVDPEERRVRIAEAIGELLDDIEADPSGSWALAIPSAALGESLEAEGPFAGTRDRLRAAGEVVHLTADLSTLVTRNGLIGPRSTAVVMPRKEFRAMLERRTPIYDAVSTATYDTTASTPAVAAEEIVSLLGAGSG